MTGLLEPSPKSILLQVIGWVLVLPLLVSFVKLPFPFPLGMLPSLGAIVASVYGVRFARRRASHRVTMMALIVTVLNILSFFGLSTASFLKALYYLSRFYWYAPLSNWVYWNV